MARPNRRVIEVTPALANFASAYAANDQLGIVNTLANALSDEKGISKLVSVSILDKAKQKKALDVFLFDASPTLVSADNDEFEMTDANMLKCIGVVKVDAADYSDNKNSAVATIQNLNLMLQGVAASTSLYCVLVTRGTPTYGAAGDLVVKLGFDQQ